jgi:hypothetical protein
MFSIVVNRVGADLVRTVRVTEQAVRHRRIPIGNNFHPNSTSLAASIRHRL